MQCIIFINSNLHLNRERILSNVRVKVLVYVVILECARRFATYMYTKHFISPASSSRRILSSVQLLFKQLCSSMSGVIGQEVIGRGVIGLLPDGLGCCWMLDNY